MYLTMLVDAASNETAVLVIRRLAISCAFLI
jgi:hypothetical protein